MGELESVAAGDDLDTRSHAINERVVGDVTGMLSMSSSLRTIHIHHTHTPLEATEFGEITQNNGHYTIHGHSRSPILVPIESPYLTSY